MTEQTTEGQRLCACGRPAAAEDSRMCVEHRKLWDAHADHEILEPWVEACQPIGCAELTRVMEKALEEVDEEVRRTMDNVERAEAALEEGSYSPTDDDLSYHS